MKKPRRRRCESELDYTKDAEENSKILLKEKYEMLKWTDTVEIKTPNLLIPNQIANYVESLPFCKLAVSPQIVLLSSFYHNTKFKAVNNMKVLLYNTEVIVALVLEDEFAQYCLLEFTASGSLLLSTRSTAHIDVFDHQGGYCYDIPLNFPENNLDLVCAISAIRTTKNNFLDDKYLDVLYVLQYNSRLSVYKIGRLSRYQKMWSISLEMALAGTFCISQQYNLLLVSSHYRVSSDENSPGGLCSFRLVDSDPFVEPIRLNSYQGGWLSRLPFSSASYAYLVSMSISESASKLAAVSSNGDFFLYDIPSTRIDFSIKYISGPRPVQVVFTENEEIGVLFHSGEFIRSELKELQDSIYSMCNCEKFTSRSTIVAPCHRELFILTTDEGTDTLREVASQRASLACRLWIYTLWGSLKKVVGMAFGDATVTLEKATYSESLDFALLHEPTRTLQELFERTLNERDYSRAKSLAENYDTIDIDVVLKREWRDICHLQTITVESVDNTLRQINDRDWVVEACITSNAHSLEVQKALIDLGTSYSNVSLASQVRLHHNARILEVCDCVEDYIEVRNLSCLDAAFRFAERLNFVLLDRIIDRNFSILVSYMLDIISHIPSSVPPNRFEHFLLSKDEEIVGEEKKVNPHVEAMLLLASAGDEQIKELVKMLNIGNNQISVEAENFVLWARKRARLIDLETGLVDHCTALLNICLQRGYKVTQCLCNLELIGDNLLQAVISVGLCPDLAFALGIFHSHGVKPTFKQLFESTTTADGARRLLIRMARCGHASSVVEWIMLRDEVLRLASSIYSNLIDPEETVEIVTREMLSDVRVSHDQNVLKLFLTLDKNESCKNTSGRLSFEKSAEVLLAKCDELLQEAVSPSDPVLTQSRFLAETVKEIAPKKALRHLKLLDTVDLAHELGYDALPVAIKFGKKCAKLAVLLGVETPVATALSLCSLSALIANDERFLKKYINEVIAKGRDLPVVHELCVRIMESSYVPAVMEEIYACALLNSPDDKLLETLDLIQKHSSARKRRFCAKVEVNDKLVIDAMYARPHVWHYICKADESSLLTLRECSEIPTNALAAILTNISASLALCIAMSDVSNGEWTKNEFLLKYEQALRFLGPKLTEHLVERVPPSVLISQATLSDTNTTILDRLSQYGCDRERFVEDAHYRKETILGLAMTDDDDMYADAIVLAANFKLDDWPIHFASLENALTSLSIPEAKRLIKSRRHLARLRSDPNKLYSQLRSLVSPLMTSNEQFISYLTLFANGEVERDSLPVLKRIIEKRKEVKAAQLFVDPNYFSEVIVSMPDQVIISLANEMRIIPVGIEACELAARTLLDGSDIRPAANPLAIFMLLGNDEANFIDLLASKNVIYFKFISFLSIFNAFSELSVFKISEEIVYLENALLMLEATPKVDSKLLNVVRERLNTLRMTVENGSCTSEPFGKDATVFHRRKR
ncbi:hypothetical protein DICVIV_09499 [Dictyocaulus viviparus]|uniref:Sec39 domain-containing protein n=1 Tax=Dictyocaulus viviparus TaxID=29172 RepID=A0A0D8XQ10_DICVI|nr:hypothetical protein DICVIV_09499 [Dictyocaulus viviparus]